MILAGEKPEPVVAPSFFEFAMSALGQKRTFAVQNAMSALPPKADIRLRACGGDLSATFHQPQIDFYDTRPFLCPGLSWYDALALDVGDAKQTGPATLASTDSWARSFLHLFTELGGGE